MARRRSSRPSGITSRSLPLAVRRPLFIRPLRAIPSPLADRRQFHPERRFRPVYASPRSAARVVVRQDTPFRRPDVFRFALPHRVRLCVQRKERREVLFAKRKTGKGARSPKRRNYWSAVSCK